MPTAIAIASVTYEVTDLDRMEAFLTDFGLVRAHRTATTLYMRCADAAPYVHVSRLTSANRFGGVAFTMARRDDLDALARLPGSAAVESIDAPGGGSIVRMTMPDGHVVSAVADITPAAPLVARAPYPFNSALSKSRANVALRPRREPGHTLRLGHCVLKVLDHDRAVAWLTERFGFLASDYFCNPGDESKVIGTFLQDRATAIAGRLRTNYFE